MNRFTKTLTINFDPHHICNYRCPYCFIPDKNKDIYPPFSHFSPVAAWIEAISKIERNIHFSISGIGEPTLLKDFYHFSKGRVRVGECPVCCDLFKHVVAGIFRTFFRTQRKSSYYTFPFITI